MSEGRKEYLAGLASDLLFSCVTYIVLSTIISVIAILLAPSLSPIVGETVARAWWVPVVLGYCVWQFLKFRRLRQAEREIPKI